MTCERNGMFLSFGAISRNQVDAEHWRGFSEYLRDDNDISDIDISKKQISTEALPVRDIFLCT